MRRIKLPSHYSVTRFVCTAELIVSQSVKVDGGCHTNRKVLLRSPVLPADPAQLVFMAMNAVITCVFTGLTRQLRPYTNTWLKAIIGSEIAKCRNAVNTTRNLTEHMCVYTARIDSAEISHTRRKKTGHFSVFSEINTFNVLCMHDVDSSSGQIQLAPLR